MSIKNTFSALGTAALMATAGCNDGGYEIENPNNPDQNGEGGQYGGGNGTPECKPVPQSWDLRAYAGCKDKVDLTVSIKGNDGKLQNVPSKAFQNVTPGSEFENQVGQLVYWHDPNSQDCGPMDAVAVNTTGTFEYAVSAPVNFYKLQYPLLQEVWMKTHNGTAPTLEDLKGIDFGNLAMQIVDCATTDKCELPSTVVIPPKTEMYQGTGTTVVQNGAFCGVEITVMRSK